MGLQRQRQVPVVLDHMRAERHRRQSRVGLRLGAGRLGEQRQIVLVADPVEAARRPQRLAPVEAERAEGVGVGELFEHGGRRPLR